MAYSVVLCLGTNLGDRKKNIQKMVAALNKILLYPVKTSRLMETEPIGTEGNQDWFYNCIISGKYNGLPHTLLDECLAIEKELGRKREFRYEPRTADIDILLFDSIVINENNLVIPHPEILNRRFCIDAVVSILPDFIHPVEKKTFSELLITMDEKVRKQQIRTV